MSAFVGGTFACFQNPQDELWCVGDDHFGQLAARNPPPDAGPNAPPLFSVWPAIGVTLGTWHACAVAARGTLEDTYAACWGRGDVGQLGARAPDHCVVDGKNVPCAKTPVKGVRLKTAGMAVLAAGDLFTCVTDHSGIRCWGASQDGFFGAPGSCPKSLERAWPTPGGPVAAPHARCSAAPQPVAGVQYFEEYFRVGPRGLCFSYGNNIGCVGAIPTPRLDNVQFPSVSPGQDASACTVQDGTVLCWGEGYSPPGALDEPVAVVLEPPEPASEVAVVRSGNPAEWSASCLVHEGCAAAPVAMPRCAPDLHADDWSQILLAAPTLAGKTVHARGLLAVGPMSGTAVGCSGPGTRACCNHSSGPVVLGGATKRLALDGLGCSGDESLVCCNAPAYGQSVVATGELIEETGFSAHNAPWRLDRPTLCTETSEADR